MSTRCAICGKAVKPRTAKPGALAVPGKHTNKDGEACPGIDMPVRSDG